ncbi:M48 family metalloprotease [Rhodoferax sp.]|uniref:M48 family metalloprotease n=1 Tax=Rhodoferax sp. TaxID=50421 RepID=UPI0025F5B8C5|nr:M48 family metalloprotease [Rhodoferax sp.]
MTAHVVARLTTWLSLCALLSCFPLQTRADEPAKALGNLLQNLMKGAGGATMTPGNAAAPGSANDLLSLLNQSLDTVDEPKELELGRQLAAILLGAKPLSPNMALQRYVNRLGRWLAQQSTRPDLPWTFGVLEDAGFNAFAAPGGYVFITKGLLDAVKDESELAGILAHEIQHVVGKHHLKAMRKTAQAGLLTSVIAARLSDRTQGALQGQLLLVGKDMYAKGLDQSDELEADRTGVALAARAGFDPYGLVAVLQGLRTAAPDNPMFSLQISTHPPTEVRLEQLEQAMGQRLDAFSGAPSLTIAQRLARGVGR